MTTTVPQELSSMLLGQAFLNDAENRQETLAAYKEQVQQYVAIENNVAVLSDFSTNSSYIYAGAFGHFFGLPQSGTIIESAFEDFIFNKIHPDDIAERHVLELRYIQLQNSLPAHERIKYSTCCTLRALNPQGSYVPITHRMLYPKSLVNGSIWLALCLYAPAANNEPQKGINGRIINTETGEVLPVEAYSQYDRQLLSTREAQVLALIAKGIASKEIAGQLHISAYTVNRHRQNIISKMQVANTAEAVKTALMMGIIE
ncbi:histidine kinase [Flavobacterium akiainvivens]|uniref:Histidine kinase n=1 Tax=Flavobacterium akiainvivens TaxID=1202724 RepID=A0A0M8MAF0_9FLAO|nr:LuxR C-terminal-related transcriptional regulator [Flavobacterium akiainvivens]KOS06983.1 histidine kinase [Flavobacterium akiainvivens]SFQ59638.1 regulatory protein, luxR family [Flavobacterium akiainvivens]